MNEELEDARCAICAGSEVEPLFHSENGRRIVRCRRDGLVYMSPGPRLSFLCKFHASFVRRDNLELFDSYRRTILQREAQIIKRAKSSGNLLDIGCATGALFGSFQNHNWRLFGVDTSCLGLDIARKKYHAQVFCGTVCEAQYPDEYFDVVTILDTLYYNPDPRAELTEVARILKNDGLLVVEVPGFAYTFLRDRGPVCWVLNKTWSRGFTDSYHLFYFSPKTIRLLLRQAGFSVFEMVAEQASLARQGLPAVLNQLHFDLARLVFRASAGRISVAGKELYLASKVATEPGTNSKRGTLLPSPDECGRPC